MGLIDSSGNPHPAYNALKALIGSLGSHPTYHGWLRFNAPRDDYGFVFAAKATNVMVAWGPAGNITGAPIVFGTPLTVLDPVTGSSATVSSVSLRSSPVVVLGVPDTMVAGAEVNKGKPLPWGDYSPGDASVSVIMGAVNKDTGMHMLHPDAAPAVTVYGGLARDVGKTHALTFAVDPSFLDYSSAKVNVSCVVRRHEDNGNAGFNLKSSRPPSRGRA